MPLSRGIDKFYKTFTSHQPGNIEQQRIAKKQQSTKILKILFESIVSEVLLEVSA
jgi:hypothetical protein